MRTGMLCLALAFAPIVGCGGGSNQADQTVDEIVGDTGVLQEAEAAANQVIRAVGDCDAVNAAYSDAITKLDEAESRVQTEAGRTTLQTLRRQVETAGEACGNR